MRTKRASSMPRDSDGLCGHSTRSGSGGLRRELDLVAALGDAPCQLSGTRGGRPGEPLVGERPEDRVELVATEAGVQPGDDERGGLAIDVRPYERGREHLTVIRRRRRASGLDVRAGIIDAELPGGAQDAGAELHRREMPFTDRPQAQDEPAAPGRQARLVGVHDRGGVEEGGRLDRELVGEPGAHEAASLVRQIGSVGYPVRDLLRSAPSARPAGHGGAPRSGHRPVSRSLRPRRRAARGSATAPLMPGTDHRARARDRARTAAPAPAPGRRSVSRRSA